MQPHLFLSRYLPDCAPRRPERRAIRVHVALACPPCRVGVTRRAALKLEGVVIRTWAGTGLGRRGCSGVMAWGPSDALSGMFASKAEGVHACGLHWCLCCLASLAFSAGLGFLAAGTEVVGAAAVVVFVSLSAGGSWCCASASHHGGRSCALCPPLCTRTLIACPGRRGRDHRPHAHAWSDYCM